MGGDVTVTLTVDGGTITNVDFSCKDETPGLGDKACEALAGKLKGQSGVSLDNVSGATISSEAFIGAAKEAYAAAKAADKPKETTTTAQVTEATTAQTTTTVAATTTEKVTTTAKNEVKDEAPTESKDDINVGLVAGIIAVIAIVGFVLFKKFGPKE